MLLVSISSIHFRGDINEVIQSAIHYAPWELSKTNSMLCPVKTLQKTRNLFWKKPWPPTGQRNGLATTGSLGTWRFVRPSWIASPEASYVTRFTLPAKVNGALGSGCGVSPILTTAGAEYIEDLDRSPPFPPNHTASNAKQACPSGPAQRMVLLGRRSREHPRDHSHS